MRQPLIAEDLCTDSTQCSPGKKDQTTPSFRNLIVEYFQVVVRMDLIVPEMDLNGDLLINALMPLIARVHRQVEALSRY
jgi:hypothetical protein